MTDPEKLKDPADDRYSGADALRWQVIGTTLFISVSSIAALGCAQTIGGRFGSVISVVSVWYAGYYLAMAVLVACMGDGYVERLTTLRIPVFAITGSIAVGIWSAANSLSSVWLVVMPAWICMVRPVHQLVKPDDERYVSVPLLKTLAWVIGSESLAYGGGILVWGEVFW